MTTPAKALLILCLCLALLTGCAPAAEQTQGAYTFSDDLGRTVNLDRPERVVALIGSFADVWCLAGGKETLVGTAEDAWTAFSLELDESVVNIGTVKEPAVETILALEPDLVIGSTNTAADVDMLETLERAGIPAACFDVQSFEDYLRMLRICCTLTGDEAAWERAGESVKAEVDAAIARQDGSAPSVLCLRATARSCRAKSGRDNLLGEMLASLGCRNIADSDETVLENLSMEAILNADPDYIFVVLQGSDSAPARETLEKTLLSSSAWSSLSAVRNGNFHILEQELYNLKPNARWGEAYEKLADILYPQ